MSFRDMDIGISTPWQQCFPCSYVDEDYDSDSEVIRQGITASIKDIDNFIKYIKKNGNTIIFINNCIINLNQYNSI